MSSLFFIEANQFHQSTPPRFKPEDFRVAMLNSVQSDAIFGIVNLSAGRGELAPPRLQFPSHYQHGGNRDDDEGDNDEDR